MKPLSSNKPLTSAEPYYNAQEKNDKNKNAEGVFTIRYTLDGRDAVK